MFARSAPAFILGLLLLATAGLAADLQKPQWSYLSQSSAFGDIGGNITFTALWTDDVALDKAFLQFNWTLDGVQTPSYTNIIQINLNSTSSWSNTTVAFPTGFPIGVAVGWRWWGFDASGKSNVSDFGTFVTRDAEPPKFKNIFAGTTVIPGNSTLLAVNVTDNVALAQITLEITEDNKTYNYSVSQINGTAVNMTFNYSAPANLTPGMPVKWKIYLYDTAGNIAVNLGTFGTPICPDFCAGVPPGGCTDWAECKDGKQLRTCYDCDSTTGYSCAARNETRPCPTVVTLSDAQAAMDAAKVAITDAQTAGKNTTEADTLLSGAKGSFSKGNFEDAKLQADQAVIAAQNAPLLQKPAGGPSAAVILVIGLVIIVALTVVAMRKGWLGGLKLPGRAKKKKEEEETPYQEGQE